jgi:uncharacterized membrane protein YoaK (UPF0700 family)
MTIIQGHGTGNQPASPEAKTTLAVILAGVGGYVDAVGYVALFKLFTAHQSGNSVGLGVAIGQGDWTEALHRVTPIGSYVVGVAIGAAVIELAYRSGARSAAAVALALEALLLAGAVGVGAADAVAGRLPPSQPGSYYLAASLLAGAMGVQSSALRRASGMPMHTTFVTGVLTNLAEAVAVLVMTPGHRRKAVTSATPLALVWVTYLGSAVTGALAQGVWSLTSLAVPIAALLAVAGADLRRPVQPSLFPPDTAGE